jgi:hypothetical protein
VTAKVAVAAPLAAQLQANVGKTVPYTQSGNTLTLIGAHVAANPGGIKVAANVADIKAAASVGAPVSRVSPTMYEGMVAAATPNTVTVRFANGSTCTYNVNPQTSAALVASRGKNVAFHIVGGTLQLVHNVTWAVLQSVKNDVATLRNAAGAVTTVALNAKVAAELHASVGKIVAVTADGTLVSTRGTL